MSTTFADSPLNLSPYICGKHRFTYRCWAYAPPLRLIFKIIYPSSSTFLCKSSLVGHANYSSAKARFIRTYTLFIKRKSKEERALVLFLLPRMLSVFSFFFLYNLNAFFCLILFISSFTVINCSSFPFHLIICTYIGIYITYMLSALICMRATTDSRFKCVYIILWLCGWRNSSYRCLVVLSFCLLCEHNAPI